MAPTTQGAALAVAARTLQRWRVNELGEYLRGLRTRHGHGNRSKFAKELGVEYGTAIRWEREGAIPGHASLEQIVEVLKLTAEEQEKLTRLVRKAERERDRRTADGEAAAPVTEQPHVVNGPAPSAAPSDLHATLAEVQRKIDSAAELLRGVTLTDVSARAVPNASVRVTGAPARPNDQTATQRGAIGEVAEEQSLPDPATPKPPSGAGPPPDAPADGAGKKAGGPVKPTTTKPRAGPKK